MSPCPHGQKFSYLIRTKRCKNQVVPAVGRWKTPETLLWPCRRKTWPVEKQGTVVPPFSRFSPAGPHGISDTPRLCPLSGDNRPFCPLFLPRLSRKQAVQICSVEQGSHIPHNLFLTSHFPPQPSKQLYRGRIPVTDGFVYTYACTNCWDGPCSKNLFIPNLSQVLLFPKNASIGMRRDHPVRRTPRGTIRNYRKVALQSIAFFLSRTPDLNDALKFSGWAGNLSAHPAALVMTSPTSEALMNRIRLSPVSSASKWAFPHAILAPSLSRMSSAKRPLLVSTTK